MPSIDTAHLFHQAGWILLVTLTKFLLPLAAGAVLAGLAARAALSWAENSLRRRRIRQATSARDITPRDFELLCCDLLRAMGYRAKLTPYQGDGGADIVARDGRSRVIIVQCKRWLRRPVGVNAVRELAGVRMRRNADEAWLISAGTFTAQARVEAKALSIRLIDGYALRRLLREHGLTPQWE